MPAYPLPPAELFHDVVAIDVNALVEQHPENLLSKALTNHLAIPRWKRFTSEIKGIFRSIRRHVKGGSNAQYIPVLAEADPSKFAVSVCTVDGQMYSVGDYNWGFSIQSCVKPLLYAMALQENGLKRVHRHVGHEASGLAFNEVSLNKDELPYNPMVNSGAIATASTVRPQESSAARFRAFKKFVEGLAGPIKVGFSQPTYLCESETAWRNNALVYFMMKAGVFSKDVDPLQSLDFYLQACSIEVTARAAACVAATLATGGIMPLTGERQIESWVAHTVIQQIFVGGMYDASGEWSVQVGLPAKSGVAGLIYVIIPNRAGIAIVSPPLDDHGNSFRGVEFCRRLLRSYPLGIFDQIISASIDERGHSNVLADEPRGGSAQGGGSSSSGGPGTVVAESVLDPEQYHGQAQAASTADPGAGHDRGTWGAGGSVATDLAESKQQGGADEDGREGQGQR